jgi:quinol monooxygenase YgiN
MIFEIATLRIYPEQAEAFEDAVLGCADLFRQAAGCTHMRLERVLETSGKYHLVVAWETVEDHMVTFRQSAAYASWREAVGAFFVSPPQVAHSSLVAKYF